jgi:hypothetical protein
VRLVEHRKLHLEHNLLLLFQQLVALLEHTKMRLMLELLVVLVE